MVFANCPSLLREGGGDYETLAHLGKNIVSRLAVPCHAMPCQKLHCQRTDEQTYEEVIKRFFFKKKCVEKS
eukprot:SAG22_NODE_2120_length_2981_cov_1.324080_7_plen_71_part_00